MSNLAPDLDAIPAFVLGRIPLQPIVDENMLQLGELAPFDPLRMAATFAGLLTLPELQSNCIRIEGLVHLSLVFGDGQRKPNPKIISKLFAALGEGIVGRLEDPAEDVFVSSIATPRGNFRILQGVWESNSFYVQRVVNALESIPADGRFDQMRNCVYALLSLSDVVCERAGLTRHQLGNVDPEKILPKKIAESGRSFGKVARFTEADFAAVGISVDDLADFVFDSSMRRHLAEETIGHSTLERFPIAHRNGQYFLLLPTAVGTAIRRYIIDEMDALALRDESAETLAFEYAHLFSNTPLLGKGSGAQIGFEKTDSGLLAGGVARIDTGLYLNLIFFSDTLEGFANGGLTSWFPGAQSRELAEEVDRRIDEACEAARAETDFREGITLLVGCGIGRAIVDFTSDRQWEDWRFEFVGA